MSENLKRNEILNKMVYSYSSVSGFETCPLMFEYQYFYKVQRLPNYFAQLGTLAHEIMEKYFREELEIFELSNEFKDKYDEVVTFPVPSSLGEKFVDKTMEEMRLFFSTTTFDRNKYEVLCMEDKYVYEKDGIKIVAKPDLIIRNKETGEVILLDYKTSRYKKDSHSGYAQQLSLYKAIFESVKGIKINRMQILYFKESSKVRGEDRRIYGRFIDLEYNENILDEFMEKISLIKQEKEWVAKPDQFFCSFLCSARGVCDVKERTFGI
jgi:CRISPR/Cas system-associated exonuclease Cas4 (RecB family)